MNRSFSCPGRLLLGALLLAGLPMACSRTPPPEETTPPAPVKWENARDLSWGGWSEVLGTTQPLPRHAAQVTAAVEGRVMALMPEHAGEPVHEGQVAHEGEVIVQLDTRLVQANRDKTAAGLKEMAELCKQADIAVQSAQVEIKRLKGLMDRGNSASGLPLVSAVEMERAQLALQDAESKQRAAEARQDAAQVELKALDEQIKLYALRAPIAGHLGLLRAQLGQTLAVGALAAEVVDLDQIDLLCYVPPATAALVAQGQKAQIASDKDDPAAPKGEVVYLALTAQPDTGNFPVKVHFAKNRLPNGDLWLRANTIHRVLIETSPEKVRLSLPEAALLEDQAPPMVVVVKDVKSHKNDEGKEEQVGTAQRLQAKIGARNPLWHVVELLELVDPDTKQKVDPQEALFVTQGAHGLHNGDPVKLAAEDED